MMKIAAVILTIFSLWMTSATAQEIRASNAEERKVLSLVAALPEVQQWAKEISVKSNRKTQIT